MIFGEYRENFDELQKFAPSLVDTKEKNIKKFLVRWKPEIARFMTSQHHKTYSEFLQCAQSVA